MKWKRIAVSTNGNDGLEDSVSSVFGRANTFTIVDVKEDIIKLVQVIENPAAPYVHGAGPIVTKMLLDKDVTLVLAYEVGRGAEALFRQHNIEHIPIMAGTVVRKAIKLAIKSMKRGGNEFEI
jgi:predicted Fe-Mo cluster-binding NifX family protein